ncbi:MAG TPA: hypothetical protein PK967_01065 [Candidatus Hydrogenedentes bacterium]|nr:hypothetical protein [Candidatus Hydrogenedentota bacterium]
MEHSIAALERRLNDFDARVRRAALEELASLEEDLAAPPFSRAVNLHCHTFYSFNGYGYSPSYFAWRAKREGLYAAGIVDFDVLDAVDEFLAACRLIGLRGCAGIETRVFVPPFQTREVNSPGEPGVAYHMGAGFVSSTPKDPALLSRLKTLAQDRTRGIANRVNPYLAPATVDFDTDVLPLTPKGNATERHLCAAYDIKARALFPEADARAAFWTEKLNIDRESVRRVIDDPPSLQALIRAKTMKAGGVGYVPANGPDFPGLDEVNAFTLENGAIPTFAWLDGTTDGEQAIEELFDVMVAGGAAAVNVIPDRNWNIKDPAIKAIKLAKLHEFVAMARDRGMPVLAGTEMNAHGNRFVDDFTAPELEPVIPAFLDGAHILYAHTRLQAHGGMGYLSVWARGAFADVSDKNAFFRRVGEKLAPSDAVPAALNAAMNRDEAERALGLK